MSFSANVARNDLQVGLYGFHQSDDQFFGVLFNDGSGNPIAETDHGTGGLAAFFIDDKFKPFSWLTLSVGMRVPHTSAAA